MFYETADTHVEPIVIYRCINYILQNLYVVSYKIIAGMNNDFTKKLNISCDCLPNMSTKSQVYLWLFYTYVPVSIILVITKFYI